MIFLRPFRAPSDAISCQGFANSPLANIHRLFETPKCNYKILVLPVNCFCYKALAYSKTAPNQNPGLIGDRNFAENHDHSGVDGFAILPAGSKNRG